MYMEISGLSSIFRRNLPVFVPMTAMESPWQVFPTTQESLSGTSTIDGDNHLYRFSIFAISILT